MLKYIKLSKIKRTKRHVKTTTTKRTLHTNRQIPFEIQELICNMILEDDNEVHQYAMTCITVCKAWARLVCTQLYSECQFKNYVQFIGFVNTVSEPTTSLPYNIFVKKLDLTLVNKYGVDQKMRRLLTHCPNLQQLVYNHTSVKPKTLQLMGKHCHQVRHLTLGCIQSFPFMFHCDFSGMTQLTTMSLCLTPIEFASLQTIPGSIRSLSLSQMNAIQTDEFLQFLRQHQHLLNVSIHQCKLLTKFADVMQCLPRLEMLELVGCQVTDDSLLGVFDIPRAIRTLKLQQSEITDKTLMAIAYGALEIEYLDISQNKHITKEGIEKLYKRCHRLVY